MTGTPADVDPERVSALVASFSRLPVGELRLLADTLAGDRRSFALSNITMVVAS